MKNNIVKDSHNGIECKSYKIYYHENCVPTTVVNLDEVDQLINRENGGLRKTDAGGMRPRMRVCLAITLGIVGVILVTLAIALPFVFPALFEAGIQQKLVLQPGSDSLQRFVDPPVPYYLQFWFFNITNPQEVILNGTMPDLQEVGPYSYKQLRQKIELNFTDDGGILHFRYNKTHYYEVEMSDGKSEEDQITTINPVYLTLAAAVHKGLMPAPLAQIWFLRFNAEPFMTHSVSELTFKGYEEPLFKELFKLKPEPAYKSGKFGFMYPKNGSTDETYDIFTGINGMHNFRSILKYQDKLTVDYWNETYCNMINGSLGGQFRRPVEKYQRVQMFSNTLCRSIFADYEKEIYIGTLTVYRFRLTEELLAKTPENACYCLNDYTCKKGIINTANCHRGSPIIVSFPHFYHGDEKDQKALNLNPRKDDHETYVDVHPLLGVTVAGHKRIQVNMPLRNYADFPLLTKVPEIILPVFWVNESALITLERANMLHEALTSPQLKIQNISWALLAVGSLMIVGGVVLTITVCRSKGEKQANRKGSKKESEKRQKTQDINLDKSAEEKFLEKGDNAFE